MLAFCAFHLEACSSVPEQGTPCWAAAGELGGPREPAAAAGPSYLRSMELPFSPNLIPSCRSWDWGWKGVMGGRKLPEYHKFGL